MYILDNNQYFVNFTVLVMDQEELVIHLNLKWITKRNRLRQKLKSTHTVYFYTKH